MELNMSGKWALITGGANGIGEDISREFASEGVNLVVTSRTSEPIERLKEKLSEYKVSVVGIEVDFLENDWLDSFEKKLEDIIENV